MGFLECGTPLKWYDSTDVRQYVKEHGLLQFIYLFNLNKDRYDTALKWGDEVEFTLIEVNDNKKDARLLLKADEVINELKSCMNSVFATSSSAASLSPPVPSQCLFDQFDSCPFSVSNFRSCVSSNNSLSTSYSSILNSSFPSSPLQLSPSNASYLPPSNHNMEKHTLVSNCGCACLRGELQSDWHPEYGTHMVEAIPYTPYDFSCNILPLIEISMKLRRKRIQAALRGYGEVASITVFPLAGVGNFTSPFFETETVTFPIEEGQESEENKERKNQTKKKKNTTLVMTYPKYNQCTKSVFLPDNLINPHPRFSTLTANIRTRRCAKVAILIPVFIDKNTLLSKIWSKAKNIEDINRKEIEELSKISKNPVHKYIYMDAMGFGMGMSCIQSTYLCPSLHHARYLYDQLAVLAPIWIALTASTPFLRGMLANTDTRWESISSAVDCRTEEEMAYIKKSRFSSVSLYISNAPPLIDHIDEYNDTKVVIDEQAYKKLIDEGVDAILAKHVAYLLIRDPLVIFSEMIHLNDRTSTTHFENIQSTNWNTVRFKPPLASLDGVSESTIGWRVEFRSSEAQFTDFENAAFTALICIIIQVILKDKLDFYIPMSLNDENMRRSSLINAVCKHKFYFRHNINYNTSDRRYSEMYIYNILFGEDFKPKINNIDNRSFSTVVADTTNNASNFSQAAALTHVNGCFSLPSSPSSLECTNMNLNCIIEEKKKFKGLIPVCIDYINKEVEEGRCSKGSRDIIMLYINFIHDRACGYIPTNAVFLRNMILSSPEYKNDSVVPKSVCYDICKLAVNLGHGQTTSNVLYGSHATRVALGGPCNNDICSLLSTACISPFAHEIVEEKDQIYGGKTIVSPLSPICCASPVHTSCMAHAFTSHVEELENEEKNIDEKEEKHIDVSEDLSEQDDEEKNNKNKKDIEQKLHCTGREHDFKVRKYSNSQDCWLLNEYIKKKLIYESDKKHDHQLCKMCHSRFTFDDSNMKNGATKNEEKKNGFICNKNGVNHKLSQNTKKMQECTTNGSCTNVLNDTIEMDHLFSVFSVNTPNASMHKANSFLMKNLCTYCYKKTININKKRLKSLVGNISTIYSHTPPSMETLEQEEEKLEKLASFPTTAFNTAASSQPSPLLAKRKNKIVKKTKSKLHTVYHGGEINKSKKAVKDAEYEKFSEKTNLLLKSCNDKMKHLNGMKKVANFVCNSISQNGVDIEIVEGKNVWSKNDRRNECYINNSLKKSICDHTNDLHNSENIYHSSNIDNISSNNDFPCVFQIWNEKNKKKVNKNESKHTIDDAYQLQNTFFCKK